MISVFALTGGIASGKSMALQILQRLEPMLVAFDCDRAARALTQNPVVVTEIAVAFGTEVRDETGALNRARLRELVFSDQKKRQILEDILHPLIRQECLEKLAETRKTAASSLFVADVPLLFENGFDFGQQSNLIVALSESTQRNRLKARNHFDDDLITSILAAQLPMTEKVARADVVFWNEGPPACLERQLARFLRSY